MIYGASGRQALKTPPPKPLPFATRIPSRSAAEWKFHTSKGAASNALAIKRYRNHRTGETTYLYGEMWGMTDTGEWALIKVQGE